MGVRFESKNCWDAVNSKHAVVVGEVPDSDPAEVIACLEVYSIQSDNSPQLARGRMGLGVPKNSGSKPLKDGLRAKPVFLPVVSEGA